MDEKTVKIRIRQLLLLQQEIALAGGMHQFSPQCRHYSRKLRLIFASFGLDASYENIKTVFDYPFTYSLDVANYCSVDLCPHASRWFIKYAMIGVNANIKTIEEQGRKIWSVEQRANWVYDSLISLQTFGLPEID